MGFISASDAPRFSYVSVTSAYLQVCIRIASRRQAPGCAGCCYGGVGWTPKFIIVCLERRDLDVACNAKGIVSQPASLPEESFSIPMVDRWWSGDAPARPKIRASLHVMPAGFFSGECLAILWLALIVTPSRSLPLTSRKRSNRSVTGEWVPDANPRSPDPRITLSPRPTTLISNLDVVPFCFDARCAIST